MKMCELSCKLSIELAAPSLALMRKRRIYRRRVKTLLACPACLAKTNTIRSETNSTPSGMPNSDGSVTEQRLSVPLRQPAPGPRTPFW